MGWEEERMGSRVICLPQYDQDGIGGGWTFLSNLKKAIPGLITNYDNSDTYFIPSASMVSREDVVKAKEDGKKIVLRSDNIIRNSRNRNTGMSRMKSFADMADVVIFQSEFARDLLNPYLDAKRHTVILNSCDEKIFHPTNKKLNGTTNYLYIRSSTDETKNWEMARSGFQLANNPKKLTIIGKGFDQNMIDYNFDFYQGEDVRYVGEVRDKDTLADFYRANDYLLYSYFQDACSNTLIEALCCGLTVVNCYGMAETGGTPEILAKFREYGKNYFFLERMGEEYRECLQAIG